jgi:hypothetical protein
MKFTFISSDVENNQKIIYKSEEVVLSEVIIHFENFLKAVGFKFGAIVIEDEE